MSLRKIATLAACIAVCMAAAACTRGAKPYSHVMMTGNSLCRLWMNADSTFWAETGIANTGRNGDTSRQIAERMPQSLATTSPEVVVILSPATNDVAQNEGPVTDEQIIDNVRRTVSQALEAGARVILTDNLPANGFYWRPDIVPGDAMQRLNAAQQRLAEEMGIEYLELFDLLADEHGGLPERYTRDGVHINAEAYGIVGAAILGAVDRQPR